MMVSEKLIALPSVRNTFFAAKYGVERRKDPAAAVEVSDAMVGIPDNRDEHRSAVHRISGEITPEARSIRIGISPHIENEPARLFELGQGRFEGIIRSAGQIDIKNTWIDFGDQLRIDSTLRAKRLPLQEHLARPCPGGRTAPPPESAVPILGPSPIAPNAWL